MSVARQGAASTVLEGKTLCYWRKDLSGNDLASVEIFDPISNSWTTGPSLPTGGAWGSAISHGNKIFLFGMYNGSTNTSLIKCIVLMLILMNGLN